MFLSNKGVFLSKGGCFSPRVLFLSNGCDPFAAHLHPIVATCLQGLRAAARKWVVATSLQPGLPPCHMDKFLVQVAGTLLDSDKCKGGCGPHLQR